MKNLHPSTTAILRHFRFQHLPPELAAVSQPFHQLAHELVGGPREFDEDDDQSTLTLLDIELDGPELTMALRKLLEAKDCAVRAALDVIEA